MIFEGHPEALAEVREAMLWYEEAVSGLGTDFLAALERAQQLVRDSQEIGRPVILEGRRSEFRRLRLQRFPHALIYLPGAPVYVIAVAHERRAPHYWLSRAAPEQ